MIAAHLLEGVYLCVLLCPVHPVFDEGLLELEGNVGHPAVDDQGPAGL